MTKVNIDLCKETSNIMSYTQFIAYHCAQKDGLRLGQRFVNYYLQNSLLANTLFYEENDQISLQYIKTYLIDIQLYPDMPERIGY